MFYIKVQSIFQIYYTTQFQYGLFGKEYITIFQLEAMYDFHKHRGLPTNTVSIVAQLEIGDYCLVSTKITDAKIKRLSKSFFNIEWIH